MKKALEGLKVLGFVTDGVGPITTRVLAMNGATVIHVESEGRPDGTRIRAPFLNNDPGLNRSIRYVMTNTQKMSVCLNMKNPDSLNVAKELIKWADVVIDNFRPGVLAKWGLGYDVQKELNDDIIGISLTARGQNGPFSKQAAYGPEVSCMSGFTNMSGWPDRSPVTLGPYTDWVAPHIGVTCILAAIAYRNRTGKGQYIDIAQVESAMNFLTPAVLDYAVNGHKQERSGNSCPYAAPHAVYRCKGEDEWCAITVFSEDEWGRFCKAIGSPEWTNDPKFATLESRKANEDELNKLIEAWTVDKDRMDVEKTMFDSNVQAGAVRTLADLYSTDKQLEARDHWNYFRQPDFGELRGRGSSYIMSKTRYTLDAPAPEIGQYTEYVLKNICNVSDEEIVKMYNEGALT